VLSAHGGISAFTDAGGVTGQSKSDKQQRYEFMLGRSRDSQCVRTVEGAISREFDKK
jgi:hypothetical protein